MKEYIERQALNKVIDYEIEVCNSGIAKSVLEMLKVRVEPAADVVEVRHGWWVRKEDGCCYWYECSECGGKPAKTQYGDDDYSYYCPNCGAKMGGIKG